jgi:hypothetical protein
MTLRGFRTEVSMGVSHVFYAMLKCLALFYAEEQDSRKWDSCDIPYADPSAYLSTWIASMVYQGLLM